LRICDFVFLSLSHNAHKKQRGAEIIIKIPKGLPAPYLKRKIEDLVREE